MKLYVAFIDFRKAFGSVIRTKFWAILRKNGLKGKMYQAIVNNNCTVLLEAKYGLEMIWLNHFCVPEVSSRGKYVDQFCFLSLLMN